MNFFGLSITRPRPRTALHPDYKSAIEFCFELKGKKFYTFTNMLDMPVRRYQRMSEFIREAELRMTRDELYQYVDLMEKAINKGNVTVIVNMITTIKYCLDIFIETETFYRLFSCALFTVDEDLTDYDDDWGTEKIAIFKSQKVEDFFFSQSIKKFLPPLNISKEDFRVFSKQSAVKKSYTSTLISEIIKKMDSDG